MLGAHLGLDAIARSCIDLGRLEGSSLSSPNLKLRASQAESYTYLFRDGPTTRQAAQVHRHLVAISSNNVVRLSSHTTQQAGPCADFESEILNWRVSEVTP